MFNMFGQLFAMITLFINGTSNLVQAYSKLTEIGNVKAGEMLDATHASRAKELKRLQAEASATEPMLIK